jgi:hypothetical protein
MAGHGAVEVGVESIRELVDKLFCTAETGGFANLVVVISQCGVAKSDVLAYLRVLGILLLERARTRLTERGKHVKSWKRMDMAVRRSASLRVLMSQLSIRIVPSTGS